MSPRSQHANLRRGFTTGACAAAAAKAATLALLGQTAVPSVEILIPHDGKRASFTVSACDFTRDEATCSIIKDAGDDPDITDGAEIRASVTRHGEAGIEVMGGQGVGIVTKPGLDVPEGQPAINPVPRYMITEAVREAAAAFPGTGFRVTVSAPDGEKLARRTLNARLGILGGISILGTSGVVIPYSPDAYTACISQAMDVSLACGCREVVLTTGRRSEKHAQAALPDLADECFAQMGDFIGFALEEAAKRPFERVTVWAMFGKMSKLAAGAFYTNVSDSVVDIRFLAGVAARCGVPDDRLAELRQAVTANHLRKLLPPAYARPFGDELCRLAAAHCRKKAGTRVRVTCIVTDPAGEVLGRADA